MSHNTNSSFDPYGSVGSPGSHTGSYASSPRSSTTRPAGDNRTAGTTSAAAGDGDKEKEKFRSSRQSSRSRRRLLSSGSFKESASGRGSGKGPILSNENDGTYYTLLCSTVLDTYIVLFIYNGKYFLLQFIYLFCILNMVI